MFIFIYVFRMKRFYFEGSGIGSRKEDDYWNNVFLEWFKIIFLLKEMLK